MDVGAEESLPLVSIVTPCYNMARYVEQTVRSVLDQDYPHIEYIVMDGGSTDGTLEILKKYEGRARIYSEPDQGAADAVNRGFERSRGSLLAFLNADDYYLPGAVATAARSLVAHPEVAGVYGEGLWVDQQGRTIGEYPTAPFDAALLNEECFICQPAAFFRRSAFQQAGGLDTSLQFAFDYDLWIRLARRHSMLKLDARLAASRMHRENKTLGARRRVFTETIAILRKHYGYVPFRWVHAYASYLADRRDQFFEPLRPTFFKYAISLPLGLYYNRSHPVKFFAEWKSVMSRKGLARRLDETWPWGHRLQ